MKYFVFILILLVLGCNRTNSIQLEGNKYDIETPPATTKISENFYADVSEVSNIDYREYQFWLSRLYGYESIEYKEALLDTLVWRNEIAFGEPYRNVYFTHPAYNSYPVVGINLTQAEKYTQWRTERVAELLLIRKGLIKSNYNIDLNNYFTIDKYIEGGYDWIIKKEVIAIPIYKIPSIQEWELIAGINSKLKYGTDSLSRHNKKILKRYKCLYQTSDSIELSSNSKYTIWRDSPCSVRELSKNINGLYSIVGNVAELVENENVIKGGSWKQKINEITLSKNESFIEPSTWIGFRNVCKFEILKKN